MEAAAAVPALRFNPRPRIARVPVPGHPPCLVVDDALLDPQAWREHAATHWPASVQQAFNGYPGPELRLPDAALAAMDHFFAAHARRELGGRRTLRRYARLSMVTTPPAELAPWQWFCHTDRLEDGPGQCVAASVLYLFDDPALGGTSFYRPRRTPAETAAMQRDASQLAPEAFSQRHGIAPGYQAGSNAWFERVASVPAQFNRLILYSGGIFHSGDIVAPGRLSHDPRRGRLTLNGFYVCTRALR